jgi:hypothetical protein
MANEQPSFEQKIEAIRETLELVASMQLAAEKRHDREIARIEGTLRRAIRLAVREARAERVRRKEGDDKLSQEMAKLAEALRRFIERGGNGHTPQN